MNDERCMRPCIEVSKSSRRCFRSGLYRHIGRMESFSEDLFIRFSEIRPIIGYRLDNKRDQDCSTPVQLEFSSRSNAPSGWAAIGNLYLHWHATNVLIPSQQDHQALASIFVLTLFTSQTRYTLIRYFRVNHY